MNSLENNLNIHISYLDSMYKQTEDEHWRSVKAGFLAAICTVNETLKNGENNDGYTVRKLALTLAVQAEIEGMKAFNEIRKPENLAYVYSGDAFQEKAEDLRNLAYSPDECL